MYALNLSLPMYIILNNIIIVGLQRVINNNNKRKKKKTNAKSLRNVSFTCFIVSYYVLSFFFFFQSYGLLFRLQMNKKWHILRELFGCQIKDQEMKFFFMFEKTMK